MTDDKTAIEVIRLRDEEGWPWKKIGQHLELSEASPSKKAKKMYEQGKGKNATRSAKKASPSASARKKRKNGMTADQAKKAEIPAGARNLEDIDPEDSSDVLNPVFFRDTPEEEVASTITGHTIIVVYLTNADTGRRKVNEFTVKKVKEFGWSGKSGTRWVGFLDNDQKSRTVPISAIVGVK